MAILLTGAAGFIGYHTALRLLDRGEEVIGVDNLNDYYDPRLKAARLAQLRKRNNFSFHRADISDRAAMGAIAAAAPDVDQIIHLAAQAGVRYSLINPQAYVDSNVTGQLVMLVLARPLPAPAFRLCQFVIGLWRQHEVPFSVDDRVDKPVSLYAATETADELMSRAYAHLYRLPATGLRFFTVYGPWGRPDMSLFIFTRAILAGEPIQVFNHGEMKRDFTYIDDIVDGVVAALDHPPEVTPDGEPPHRLYNLGNHRCEPLMRFIEVIEKTAAGRRSWTCSRCSPAMCRTPLPISRGHRDLGFALRPIDEGVPRFVHWYRDYHGV